MITGNNKTNRTGSTANSGELSAIQSEDLGGLRQIDQWNLVPTSPPLIDEIALGSRVNESEASSGAPKPAESSRDHCPGPGGRGDDRRAHQYSSVYWRALAFKLQLEAKCPAVPQ